MDLEGLSFSTVCVIAAFLSGIVAMTLSIFVKGHTARVSIYVAIAGLASLSLGGMIEGIHFPSLAAAIDWSHLGIILAVFGTACILMALKILSDIGMPLWWYGAVIAFNLISTGVIFFYAKRLYGMRSIVYSLSCLLLSVPVIVQGFRSGHGRRYSRLISVFLGGYSLGSFARLLFAFLDLGKDDFIRPSLDAWIYAGILAFGLGVLIVYIILVAFPETLQNPAAQRRRISLAEAGLSPAEVRYVLEVVKGRGLKEIAVAAEVSESTVRNTLARAYKKLGVEGLIGLARLSNEAEIEH